MTIDRARLLKTAPISVLAGTLVLVGCWPHDPAPPPQPAAAPAVQEIVPVAGGGTAMPLPMTPLASPGESPEAYVDLEMADAPVKLVLERLADIAGLQLIIPPNLDRTISVQYVRVPVSVALADVLKRSGLRLGPAPAPTIPFDTVTVFYKLPANIDSMSVDAIVLRFGVSRAMAELIVKSRKP